MYWLVVWTREQLLSIIANVKGLKISPLKGEGAWEKGCGSGKTVAELRMLI